MHLWTLYISHLLLDCQISYMDYFNQTLAKVSIFVLSVNPDGHQNVRQVSNLVIFYPNSPEFHIWTTFVKQLFLFEYGFCPTNSNQDCRQTDRYPLFHSRALCGALCRNLTVLVKNKIATNESKSYTNSNNVSRTVQNSQNISETISKQPQSG